MEQTDVEDTLQRRKDEFGKKFGAMDRWPPTCTPVHTYTMLFPYSQKKKMGPNCHLEGLARDPCRFPLKYTHQEDI